MIPAVVLINVRHTHGPIGSVRQAAEEQVQIAVVVIVAAGGGGMVKLVTLSPEWPEAALLADPRILQAVVVGDGQPALSAILVPLPGVPPTAVQVCARSAMSPTMALASAMRSELSMMVL